VAEKAVQHTGLFFTPEHTRTSSAGVDGLATPLLSWVRFST